MHIKKVYKNEDASYTRDNIRDFVGKAFVLNSNPNYEVQIAGIGDLLDGTPVVLLSNNRYLTLPNFNRSYLLKDDTFDRWAYTIAVADAYAEWGKKNGMRPKKHQNGSYMYVDFNNGDSIGVSAGVAGITIEGDPGVFGHASIRIPASYLKKYATPEEAAAAIVADHLPYI